MVARRPRRITSTRYSHRNVAVSPDGQWVAFVAVERLRPDSIVDQERDSLARLPYDAKRDEVDRNNADIYVIPVAGGTVDFDKRFGTAAKCGPFQAHE